MKFKMQVIYNGRKFCGWEGNERSVRFVLEKAIKTTLGSKEYIEVHCAGRTDKGVHGLGQIIHIELPNSCSRTSFSIERGINFYLKKWQSYCWVSNCEVAKEDFHARFTAKQRHYRYYLTSERNQLLDKFCAYVPGVDWDVLRQGCELLEGYYDISCFCPRDYSGRRDRTVLDVSLHKQELFGSVIYYIQVSAPGFAYHQVRYMVGSLVRLGQGQQELDCLKKNIINKKRIYLMSPKGLFLYKVTY